MLVAGLDGIANHLTPPEPVEENVYHLADDVLKKRNIATLPGSLAEALEELNHDPVVRDTLGSHIFTKLVEMADKDVALYREKYLLQVSEWERERYMNR
jgi:glutamine synthetase